MDFRILESKPPSLCCRLQPIGFKWVHSNRMNFIHPETASIYFQLGIFSRNMGAQKVALWWVPNAIFHHPLPIAIRYKLLRGKFVHRLFYKDFCIITRCQIDLICLVAITVKPNRHIHFRPSLFKICDLCTLHLVSD